MGKIFFRGLLAIVGAGLFLAILSLYNWDIFLMIETIFGKLWSIIVALQDWFLSLPIFVNVFSGPS